MPGATLAPSLHPPAGYDSAHSQVDSDLRQMRVAGHKKLALVIWHTRHSTSADCNGFTVNSRGGRLPSHVLENLIALLRQTEADGYTEVQIRFAPVGNNSPYKWKKWKQEEFDENWSTIRTTVDRLRHVETPRLVFDLGVEFGGTACDSCTAYVTRMWRNYVDTFGAGASYGFSIAAAPGRVTRLVKALRDGGSMPDEIALDVYKDARSTIIRAANEAKAAGIAQPKFLIQETYYGDAGTWGGIRAGAEISSAKVVAIMQWPVTPGANRHISVSRPYD